MIVPFGLIAMLLQGMIFAFYLRISTTPESLATGLRFATGAAVLSWTFSTLAVAAKHKMTSVSGFVRIETAFAVAQFVLVGILWPLSARVS